MVANQGIPAAMMRSLPWWHLQSMKVSDGCRHGGIENVIAAAKGCGFGFSFAKGFSAAMQRLTIRG